MLQASSKPLTLDEFLRLPETKPAHDFIDGQIIDGQIIQKPMPQGKHSTIQRIPVPEFAAAFHLTVGQLFG